MHDYQDVQETPRTTDAAMNPKETPGFAPMTNENSRKHSISRNSQAQNSQSGQLSLGTRNSHNLRKREVTDMS